MGGLIFLVDLLKVYSFSGKVGYGREDGEGLESIVSFSVGKAKDISSIKVSGREEKTDGLEGVFKAKGNISS